MIIFGSSFIKSPKFITISSENEINSTTPNDILLLKEFNKPYKLANFCSKNSLCYAVIVSSITDALFANALDCSYIIADINLAKILQNIATDYLFEAKILAIITSDNQLEEIALNSIDGVIYKNYLKD